MTGKENLTRAIEFRGPAWLPIDIGVSLEWLYEKDAAKQRTIRDLANRFPWEIMGLWVQRNKTEPVRQGNVSRWVDEWGTGWEDDGHGAKTESYPLQSGYEAMAAHPFPDPRLAGRFNDADRQLAQRGDKYVRGSVWFTLFERLWMLRGFDNMLVDPYLDEANFCRLRDKVVEFNLGLIDQWIERRAEAVFFSDDWGSQRALLMNPDDWRRFYRPSYAKMFDRVRRGGAHVWMHLCGNITAILPDLIDIGLRVLNPVQPQAMDVRQLARDFGGKVCFNGGVDVQGTLVRGTLQDVRDEVCQLVDLFGRYNGGYIGGTSHTIMPETPLDNVIALYEAFAEYR